MCTRAKETVREKLGSPAETGPFLPLSPALTAPGYYQTPLRADAKQPRS